MEIQQNKRAYHNRAIFLMILFRFSRIKVFNRMGNNSYVDQQTLPAPMFARYIRFHPISQHSWNTLRVEVYELQGIYSFIFTLLNIINVNLKAVG